VDVAKEEPALSEKIIGKSLGNALGVFRDAGMLGRDRIKGRNLDSSLNK
jgi:hypothetical protein